jgi:hypothetical protein
MEVERGMPIPVPNVWLADGVASALHDPRRTAGGEQFLSAAGPEQRVGQREHSVCAEFVGRAAGDLCSGAAAAGNHRHALCAEEDRVSLSGYQGK